MKKRNKNESVNDMKILVADDEEIILQQIITILEKVCPEAEVSGFTRETAFLSLHRIMHVMLHFLILIWEV